MLIGPKGSGKTYIGKLVDKHTSIFFLPIEPIWLSLQPNENGWIKVEKTIDEKFHSYEYLMIENLGAGEEFNKFLESLKSKYEIKMIRVFADLDKCLNRVKTRSKKDQIIVADSQVETYNRIASNVQFDWSIEIDNNGPASDAEILESIKNL